MVDSIKLWVVVFLVIAAMIIYPSYRMAENQERNAQTIAVEATKEFVNITRGKGYIDNRDYTDYQRKLSSSGRVFDVSLEYYKKKYQPVYENPNDFYTFKDSYEVLYEGYFTQTILDKLFPLNGQTTNSLSRRFNMRVGDMVNVRIESLDESVASRIFSIFIPALDRKVAYYYGGMVTNEAP